LSDLFGVRKSDLRGPLIQFQAIEFSKAEFRALLGTINSELAQDALSEGMLDRVFEKWWPDLEKDIQSILRNYSPDKPKKKSVEEMHEEVLGLLRNVLDIRVSDVGRSLSEDLFVNIYANIDAALADPNNRLGYVEALLMLTRNVEFLHQRAHRTPQHIERAHRLLERLFVEKQRLERLDSKANSSPLSDDVPF
jgi:hypothetical protein